MKNIQIKIDEEFFYRMKKDKIRKEQQRGAIMSWESYFQLLFGLTK